MTEQRQPSSQYWYRAEPAQLHSEIWAHVRAIDHDQSDLFANFVDFAKLYSNRQEPGFGLNGRTAVRSGFLAITDNIIQQVVDTAVALVGMSRPKATVLTDGADWAMQKLARQVDRYLWGMFRALEVHEKMQMIFRDACIWGTGILKVFERENEIRIERVLPSEFFVDESELPHGGMPREVHQVRRVPREVLKGLYGDTPEKLQMIEEAASTIREYAEYQETGTDLVAVVESYRRSTPSNEDDPGKFVVSVSSGVLDEAPYERDCFPFIWFHWNPPLTGFYGQGLTEGLLGFQIRLNELNDFIRKCQDLIAVPRVAIEQGSKFFRPQLDDEIGAVYSYINKPPIWHTAEAVGAEVYAERRQIKTDAFEYAGISKMVAHATRPEGVEHAVAMRELSDHQAQRLSGQQQRYEQRHIDVAKMILKLTKEMHEDGAVEPTFMADDFVKTIDWSEVDFDKNRFVLQVEASSILNETPAGRLQKVVEMAQYGVPLEPDELRRLLSLPDHQRSLDLATSHREHAEWVILELSEERQVAPDAFMDLPMTMQLVTAAYLQAVRGRAPETTLDVFRNFLFLGEKKLQEMQQPEPALAGDPSMMDPGMDPGLDMGPPPEMPLEATPELAF